MKSFAFRRTLSLGITALIAAMLIVLWYFKSATLSPGNYVSGWTLLGMIVFLALYNIRKMFLFLPLGSSSHWLQLHIYCGLLSFLVFAIHVRFAIPTGLFEGLLAALYLLVFGTGIIGLYLTRSYPKRLTNLGDEVIFEYLPVLQRELREQIERLALGGKSTLGTTEVPEFYRDEIRPFVVSGPAIISHLVGESSRQWRAVQQAVADHRRYMNDDEQQLMDQMEVLLHRKYRLDAQYVLQGALKLWLFVHIPATYALLIFTFFHSVLVHAWSGGLL